MLFALDLGTSTTRIAQSGKGLVLSEPSLMADCGNLPVAIAVGQQVMPMLGKMPASVQLFHPLRNGHLAAPGATAVLLRNLFKRLGMKSWSRPRMRLVVPSQVTAVERAQLVQAIKEAGLTQVQLVAGPVACACASGVEVSQSKSAAIVDMSSSITEMSIVSKEIVFRRSLRLGGADFDEALRDALNQKAGVEVSLAVAEAAKREVGCEADFDDPEDFSVVGRERSSGLPRKCGVARKLAYECFEAPLLRLEELIRAVLDQLPPLVSKDIQAGGLVLTGGGALLHGLPEHLARTLDIQVRRVPDPLHCAVLGALEVPPELCEEA
jgi:rod shape-determining protein MreB